MVLFTSFKKRIKRQILLEPGLGCAEETTASFGMCFPLNSLDLVFLRTYQKSLDLLNIFWVSHSEFQLLSGEMKIHPVPPTTPPCKSQLTEASGPENWPVTDPAHRVADTPEERRWS